MPGVPVVTESCGIYDTTAPVLAGTQHSPWEASTSSHPPSGRCYQTQSPSANTCWSDVPLSTPSLLSCPPRLQDPCCQQWTTSLGSPCWPQQVPQETCCTYQVSSETQDLGSHAAGRDVAQLDLSKTQLSRLEYFNVLSLLFKVPFCKGCLRY